jgi:hypothetical protein
MAHRSDRPSKKMVPTLSDDRTCSHRYNEGEGMTVEVDCSQCSGGQSIENQKCASGIVNILASGIMPDAVVLKRFTHVRYRADSVSELFESASALASLRRLEGRPEESSDGECQTCPASRRLLASEVVRRIRSNPMSFRHVRESLSDTLISQFSSVACPGLAGCVAQVVWAGAIRRGADD